LNVASASCATATCWPAPKVAMIVPSAVMVMLSIWPAAEPFWLIDEVDDLIAFTVAPLVQVVGPASETSAAGAVITPTPLKVIAPTGPSRTVPAVVPAVPVAYVPGTVTS
jgi:hypothetical protein